MRASYCNLALADDDHAVRKSLAFLLTLTGNQVVDTASADEFLQRGDLNRVSGLIPDHHRPTSLVWTGCPAPGLAAEL
jgi:FixJ family two-component response regulator